MLKSVYVQIVLVIIVVIAGLLIFQEFGAPYLMSKGDSDNKNQASPEDADSSRELEKRRDDAASDATKPQIVLLAKEKWSDDYPLTTCVISDGALDSMGGPNVYLYQGQEVRFCCNGCVNVFLSKPEIYLTKIKEARKQKAGLTTQPSMN